MAVRILPAVVVLAVALTTASQGAVREIGDAALRSALVRYLPAALQAGRAAAHGRGSPEQVQGQYDAARDLQDALWSAEPVSDGCRSLLRAANDLARGEIEEAEGVDRLSPALLSTGTRLLTRSDAALARMSRYCTAGRVRTERVLPEPISPRSGEAFFGSVRARAPARATEVEMLIDERVIRVVRLRGRSVALRVDAATGRHDLELRFLRGSRVAQTQAAPGVWLLPASSQVAAPSARRDRAIDARAAALANGFQAASAIWVESLRTGTYGGWNTDARFPAASTVKLGVLVAALAKFGPTPESSKAAYDLATLTAWSSNLAANRLDRKIGGSSVAQAALQRLGAVSSTYPGDYRVGTVVHRTAGDAPDQPPLVSGRVTTAHDLARIFYDLQAAAVGTRAGLAATGLTVHEARVGLALLLDSQPTGDNLGLFRPWVARSFPMAQKQGWIDDARHTAAILFGPKGPEIAIVLTYRPGITRPQAALLGRSVVRMALSIG